MAASVGGNAPVGGALSNYPHFDRGTQEVDALVPIEHPGAAILVFGLDQVVVVEELARSASFGDADPVADLGVLDPHSASG
jgi:hypothetical protein